MTALKPSFKVEAFIAVKVKGERRHLVGACFVESEIYEEKILKMCLHQATCLKCQLKPKTLYK